MVFGDIAEKAAYEQLVAEGWVDVEDLAGEELGRPFYGRAGLDEVIATTMKRAAPFFKRPGR